MRFRNLLVLFICLIFTAFAVHNVLTTYRVARESSENQLKSTAFFIGITLDQTLNRIGIDGELFLDVIKSQPWEGIAFIALYDRDGIVLLHSSQRMIGQSIHDPTVWDALEKEESRTSYLKLKTGETVYVMDLPIHIHTIAPSMQLLRIALHTYPAESGLQHAKIHALTACILLCFLWTLALAYLYYSRKADELQKKEFERKRFVMLGEMAAVLAHEIRSPLGSIKGFAQLIREKAEGDTSLAEGLSVIISESQRLERLTQDLLIYARAEKVSPELFLFSELVHDMEYLLLSGNNKIKMCKEISHSNDSLFTDRDKLRQVMINLLQNAIDAIDGEGVIELHTWGDKKTIRISIRDTGLGMDEETRKKSIHPFFTTKTKGTGLGLAIVDNLVKELHGSLKIESTLNQGTSVSLQLQRTFK